MSASELFKIVQDIKNRRAIHAAWLEARDAKREFSSVATSMARRLR